MKSRTIWRVTIALALIVVMSWMISDVSSNSDSVKEIWKTNYERKGNCVMELEYICLSMKGIHVMNVSDVPNQSNVTGEWEITLLLISLVASIIYLIVIESVRIQIVVLYAILSVLSLSLHLRNKSESSFQDSHRIPTTTQDYKSIQIPYCQEMAQKDPPIPSFVDTVAVKQSEIAPSDVPAYILGTTPFWLTPWHLWLNSIAAFDTIEKYNLTKKTDIYVEYYLRKSRWRWMPKFRPVLRDADVSKKFSMSPLISSMGKSMTSFVELQPHKRRCYKKAVSGGLLWDSIPRGNNKSYGVYFNKDLVRKYMNVVASEMNIDLPTMWDKGCETSTVQAFILQRDKSAGRSIINVDDITKVLSKKNYNVTTLKLEGLSLTAQWKIFTTADIIISAFGSGLSWLPLMRRDGVVLSVIPTKGAGGDLFHKVLSGPKDLQNKHTAFGTWAQHLNYYTSYSSEVPNETVAKWKQQSVIIPNVDLIQFVEKAAMHLSGRRKTCFAW